MKLAALGVFLLLFGAPRIMYAQSEGQDGCIEPTQAVQFFLNSVSTPEPPTVQQCKKQCSAIHKGCHGVRDAQFECESHVITAYDKVEKVECDKLTGQEKKDCKMELQSEVKSFRDFLESNSREADMTCHEAESECKASCEVS